MAKRAKMKTRLTKRQMQEVIVDEAYEISPWTKKKIREVVQRANVDYPESKDALFQRLFLAYGEKRARTRTRIGRLLKKLVEFDGVDATHVTESIKSQIYPVPLGIVIIKGDAICKSYFDGDAEAASTSCMTGSYHDHDEYYARLVELYAVNPDKISLVLAHNNSRIARAILWEHSDKGDLSFLDRIYSHDQGCTNALFEWAKNNVDYCRSLHGSFYDCNKKRKLSRDQLKLTFTIKQPEKMYPYMDTFPYGEDLEDNKMRVCCDMRLRGWRGGKVRYLDSTSGGCCTLTEECPVCGIHYNKDERKYINKNYVCPICFDEKFTACEECGIDIKRDAACNHDNKPYCKACHEVVTRKCKHCDVLIGKEAPIRIRVAKNEIIERCIKCISDITEDTVQCPQCQVYINSSEIINADRTGVLCKKCASDKLCFSCGSLTRFYSRVGIKGVPLVECRSCFQNGNTTDEQRQWIVAGEPRI